MTEAAPVEAPSGEAARAHLVLTDCPLCGRDDGEPVAVGSDFAHETSRDSFLVLSCTACGLFYLSPRPSADQWSRLYPVGYFRTLSGSHLDLHEKTVRRLLRDCGALPPEARILEVAYGRALHVSSIRESGPPSWTVEVVTPHERMAAAAREAGCVVHEGRSNDLQGSSLTYDLILLVGGLEHCEMPIDELAAMRRLLRPGGRLLIVTPNAASPAWSLFRGRHWAGYDFPRHRCLYRPATVRLLASETGFTVERLGSHGDYAMWSDSASNFARDWSARPVLTSVARLSFAALGLLHALMLASGLAKLSGSHLVAVLGRPVEAVV